MTSYPISVPVRAYHGKDPKKQREFQGRIEVARRIEEYLNTKMEEVEGTRSFSYLQIALDLSLTKEAVKKILYAVDCGSNGITIRRD